MHILGSEKFLDEKISLILPGNSPYLNIFNEEIYRMLQMGFIQKWLSELMPKKDRCSSKASSIEIENHTVNLNDMQGCFLVLIAGANILLNIIAFLSIISRSQLKPSLFCPFNRNSYGDVHNNVRVLLQAIQSAGWNKAYQTICQVKSKSMYRENGSFAIKDTLSDWKNENGVLCSHIM